MSYRFLRNSAHFVPPPNKDNFEYNTSFDAAAADRLRRSTQRLVKKKRTTVTLTVIIHASHAPPLDEYEQHQQQHQQQSRPKSAKRGLDNDDDDVDGEGVRDKSPARSSSSSPGLRRVDSFAAAVLGGFVRGFASMSSPATTSATMPLANTNNNTSSSAHQAHDAAVAGSPVAATRFIRSTAGEPKISMFCTVPATATPADAIVLVDQELRSFHKRRLLHPTGYYGLHPALEGHGSIDRLTRVMHGDRGPLLDGMGPFPFPPLALVPVVFAVDRNSIVAKSEPELRMVVYRSRLLFVQHAASLSRLLREVAGHAHTAHLQWWQEWRSLKNREVAHRTALCLASLGDEEQAGRRAIAHCESWDYAVMEGFSVDVRAFFSDCVFFLRRSIASFEATRVIMQRARAECVQRVACRVGWQALTEHTEVLWAKYHRTVRDLYTETRLSLEIFTARAGVRPELAADLGATIHAVREMRTRRKAVVDSERRKRRAESPSPRTSDSLLDSVSDADLFNLSTVGASILPGFEPSRRR